MLGFETILSIAARRNISEERKSTYFYGDSGR